MDYPTQHTLSYCTCVAHAASISQLEATMKHPYSCNLGQGPQYYTGDPRPAGILILLVTTCSTCTCLLLPHLALAQLLVVWVEAHTCAYPGRPAVPNLRVPLNYQFTFWWDVYSWKTGEREYAICETRRCSEDVDGCGICRFCARAPLIPLDHTTNTCAQEFIVPNRSVS